MWACAIAAALTFVPASAFAVDWYELNPPVITWASVVRPVVVTNVPEGERVDYWGTGHPTERRYSFNASAASTGLDATHKYWAIASLEVDAGPVTPPLLADGQAWAAVWEMQTYVHATNFTGEIAVPRFVAQVPFYASLPNSAYTRPRWWMRQYSGGASCGSQDNRATAWGAELSPADNKNGSIQQIRTMDCLWAAYREAGVIHWRLRVVSREDHGQQLGNMGAPQVSDVTGTYAGTWTPAENYFYVQTANQWQQAKQVGSDYIKDGTHTGSLMMEYRSHFFGHYTIDYAAAHAIVDGTMLAEPGLAYDDETTPTPEPEFPEIPGWSEETSDTLPGLDELGTEGGKWGEWAISQLDRLSQPVRNLVNELFWWMNLTGGWAE